jgi:hypothetical protein
MLSNLMVGPLTDELLVGLSILGVEPYQP